MERKAELQHVSGLRSQLSTPDVLQPWQLPQLLSGSCMLQCPESPDIPLRINNRIYVNFILIFYATQNGAKVANRNFRKSVVNSWKSACRVQILKLKIKT